ncbi:MAG: class I SAM-dependent methyltransferase family protein [Candidatus Freyarchaeum deiterrae]
MKSLVPCLVVSKKRGQDAKLLLSELNLLDDRMRVSSDSEKIFWPLVREVSEDERLALEGKLGDFELLYAEVEPRSGRLRSILEELEGKLSPSQLALLPHSYDIVGDIAVLEIPPELHDQQFLVGEAVLRVHKNIKVVLAKAGKVDGITRVRRFTYLAGENRTTTLHRENDCVFRVDLATVYFSPRLVTEHARVARQVLSGEVVVDLFAGVGPFSILIAKMADARVYAIDVNKDAVELLKQNIQLNKVDNRVFPILGDARNVVEEEKLHSQADRVIMNLPGEAENFIDVACRVIKPEGGIIHYYQFSPSLDITEEAVEALSKGVEANSRRVVKILTLRRVRPSAPREWQVVVDAQIR